MKKREKEERRARKAALKEIEWATWDRDKIMGLRALKSAADVKREMAAAHDLMGNFDDGGVKQAFS